MFSFICHENAIFSFAFAMLDIIAILKINNCFKISLQPLHLRLTLFECRRILKHGLAMFLPWYRSWKFKIAMLQGNCHVSDNPFRRHEVVFSSKRRSILM